MIVQYDVRRSNVKKYSEQDIAEVNKPFLTDSQWKKEWTELEIEKSGQRRLVPSSFQRRMHVSYT